MELPKNKKILFFCAHPDDDTFSSGALIYNLVKNNNKVLCIHLTSGLKGIDRKIPTDYKIKIRQTEEINACKILGVRPVFLRLDDPLFNCNSRNINIIIKILKKEKPDIIFLPHEKDAHPTHKKVNKIVLNASKSIKVKKKWFYETWTPLEKPNFIFFFDDLLMKIKISAMKQYKSQLERLDFISAIIALNTFRGITGQELLRGFGKSYKSEKKYGEAFFITKEK